MISTTTSRTSTAAVEAGPLRALRRALPFVAIAALPLLLTLPSLAEPMARDEGVYFTVAKFDGLPYVHVFDHKPPFIYLWYKLALLANEGDASIETVRILAALNLSATVLIVAWIGNMLGGRRLALASGASMAAVVSNQYLQVDANTEAFMIPWLALSLATMMKGVQSSSSRWMFLSGVAIGVAMMTKTVAMANFAVMAFALAWAAWSGIIEWRRSALMVASVIAGSVLVVTLTVTPWALSGHFTDFWYANVTYNAHYGDMPLEERLFSLTRVDNRVLTASLWLWALGAAGGVALLSKRIGIREGLLFAALAGSLIGATLPGRSYPHYLVAVTPFAALVAGIGLLHILDSRSMRSRQLAGLVVALGMVASIPALGRVYLAAPERAHVLKYGESLHAARAMHTDEIAQAVTRVSDDGDRVFELGLDTQIFALADRRPAVYFNRPIAAFAIEPTAFDRTLHELHADPPEIIIDTARMEFTVFGGTHATTNEQTIDLAPRYREPIDAFIAEHYDYVETVQFAKIYRLKQ